MSEFQLKIDLSEAETFILTEIPSYQRKDVLKALSLLKSQESEFDSIGMQLTGERRQMSFISPTGSTSGKLQSSFWENIKKEVYDYFCTKSRKYTKERNRAEITFKEIVTILATSIASQFSVTYGIIAGAVSIAVLSVCKMGQNAWCETYK